jgi:uncharacterized repeat protein (TIGR04052 family)
MLRRPLTLPFLAASLALALPLASCDDESADTQTIEIRFAAEVDGAPASCGTTYDDVGGGAHGLELADLRFFVSNLRLIDDDGREVPIELDQDGKFQHDDLALLDFEDGSASCKEVGNPETNDRVIGTAPDGTYYGLRFTLGVPFEANHQNAALAPPPLNLTAMFWSWQGGYKFMRIEGHVDPGTADDKGWLFHLGSTGCDGDAMGNVTACASPNRAEIELTGFDPKADHVVFDVGALLAGVDLGANAADTPEGCMSGVTDADCAGYFANLGLPFGAAPGGAQSAFSVAE